MAAAKEKALAEHIAAHPEDAGRTVADFNWVVREIVLQPQELIEDERIAKDTDKDTDGPSETLEPTPVLEATMIAHRGRFVAYFRVSTDRQGKSGLGLEAQREAVLTYLDGGNWQLVGEFTEVESGKRSDRPQLAAALAACKRHKAKLVIAKLDRLSRNLAFIAALMDSGVEFVAVDNPHANKLTVHILAAVAQHEREMIAQRTKDALAAAKARGTVLGNPHLAAARAVAHTAQREAADAFAANVRPIIEQIRASGVQSLRGVARALTARGIKTARGGTWTPVQVSDILRR